MPSCPVTVNTWLTSYTPLHDYITYTDGTWLHHADSTAGKNYYRLYFDNFVMVPLNLTYLHCFLEYLFSLYLTSHVNTGGPSGETNVIVFTSTSNSDRFYYLTSQINHRLRTFILFTKDMTINSCLPIGQNYVSWSKKIQVPNILFKNHTLQLWWRAL